MWWRHVRLWWVCPHWDALGAENDLIALSIEHVYVMTVAQRCDWAMSSAVTWIRILYLSHDIIREDWSVGGLVSAVRFGTQIIGRFRHFSAYTEDGSRINFVLMGSLLSPPGIAEP